MSTQYAAKFTTNSSIIIPRNEKYKFGIGDFSIMATFQAVAPGPIISSIGDTVGEERLAGWQLAVTSHGLIKFTMSNGYMREDLLSASKFNLNTRYNIIITRRNGELYLYLNGRPINSEYSYGTPINISNESPIFIGGEIEDYQLGRAHFQGTIDNVAIWNISLDENSIFNAIHKIAIDTPGLVGFWQLNKDVKDSSNLANHGQNIDNISFHPICICDWIEGENSFSYLCIDIDCLKEEHEQAHFNQNQSLYIQANSPFLYGVVLDKKTNEPVYPEGATLKVFTPTGEQLNTNINTDSEFVHTNGDSVYAFCIRNPQEGFWIFEIDIPKGIDVYFNVQTIPSKDIQGTIQRSIDKLYGISNLLQSKNSLGVNYRHGVTGYSKLAAAVALDMLTRTAYSVKPHLITHAISILLESTGIIDTIYSSQNLLYTQDQLANDTWKEIQFYKTGQGSFSLILDGREYFTIMRNLLMAVEHNTYEIKNPMPPKNATFEEMIKKISDAERSAYVMMHDTNPLYHMIENGDILRYYPRLTFKGSDGRDNAKTKNAITNLKNVNAILEPYASAHSWTPLYAQHSKLSIFSVNGIKTALIGGFNITNSYWDDADHPMYDVANFHTWHDSAVLLQGPIVDIVESEFDRRWKKLMWDRDLPVQGTYTKIACWHIKHDTCLNGPNNCGEGAKNVTPYTNPRRDQGYHHPIDLMITTSEYATVVTQIKDKILQKINQSNSYAYFENFTFHDTEIADAIVDKLNSEEKFICIINLPHPTKGADTEDQKGQFFMTKITMLYMLFRAKLWTEITFSNRQTLHINDCKEFEVTIEEGKEIEYATITYTLNNNIKQSIELMFDTITDIKTRTDNHRLVFTSAVRYKTHPKQSTEKFELTNYNKKFRSIYLHSKLAIFDDEYAIIGSANFNSRSLKYDGECSVGLDSSDKVKALREDIFKHWGMSTADKWHETMHKNINPTKEGVYSIPLEIKALTGIAPPIYWGFASFLYEFSDIS